jgi:hypothetical protein
MTGDYNGVKGLYVRARDSIFGLRITVGTKKKGGEPYSVVTIFPVVTWYPSPGRYLGRKLPDLPPSLIGTPGDCQWRLLWKEWLCNTELKPEICLARQKGSFQSRKTKRLRLVVMRQGIRFSSRYCGLSLVAPSTDFLPTSIF